MSGFQLHTNGFGLGTWAEYKTGSTCEVNNAALEHAKTSRRSRKANILNLRTEAVRRVGMWVDLEACEDPCSVPKLWKSPRNPEAMNHTPQSLLPKL